MYMQTIHFAVVIVIQYVRNLTTFSKKSQPRRLKDQAFRVKWKNGIYGYRSHNFNIIPRELDITGKKIETDTTIEFKTSHRIR